MDHLITLERLTAHLRQHGKWCNDPAWILYDLLTNTRYGLGSHILTPAERIEAESNAGDQFEGTTDVATNLDVYSFQKQVRTARNRSATTLANKNRVLAAMF